MATLPPIPPNISQITAPLLLGSLFNYAMYGVLSLQVYIYHLSFPGDNWKFKTLAYAVLVIETIQLCLCAADVYYWFGSGYGNMNHLGNAYFSPFDTPLLGSITAFIIQLFFCYRIWTLRNEVWWISIIIACVSIAQLVGGVSGTVRAHSSHDFAEAHHHVQDLYLWLIGNSVADILIAVTMIILLLRARRQDPHVGTNSILIRLVRLVIETNCLTAGTALLSLILFIAFPDSNYFICPTLILGKLYSNTLLATFNNRLFFTHSARLGASSVQFEASGPPSRLYTPGKQAFDSDPFGAMPSHIDVQDTIMLDTVQVSHR